VILKNALPSFNLIVVNVSIAPTHFLLGVHMADHFLILSIDGGGFRGVYAAHFLARMEQEYSLKWREQFKLFAGTSTGSIIAAGLACGLKAAVISNFYKEHGAKIFHRRWIPSHGLIRSRYKNNHLRSVLQNIFGDCTLGQVTTPLILPAMDIGNGCIHVFKSAYDERFVRDKDVLVRDAVMASCSAPTYFDPYMIGAYHLADGGLWANSPSLVAIIDAKHRLGKNLDNLRVLSIGTGAGRSFFPQKLHWWHRPLGWGFATRWGRGRFIAMLLNLQAETANNMTRLLLKSEQLLRINFDSDSALPLDDSRDLKDLISRADRDFSHNSDRIQAFMNITKGGS
jgi:predicted acylesterase/phospholipase RssA